MWFGKIDLWDAGFTGTATDIARFDVMDAVVFHVVGWRRAHSVRCNWTLGAVIYDRILPLDFKNRSKQWYNLVGHENAQVARKTGVEREDDESR